MVRLFLGKCPAIPGYFRGELTATGFPDTAISDKTPELVVATLMRNHRIAVKCRRSERQKRAN